MLYASSIPYLILNGIYIFSARPFILPRKQLFSAVAERYHATDMDKFVDLSTALRNVLPNAVMHQACTSTDTRTLADNTEVEIPMNLDQFFVSNMVTNLQDDGTMPKLAPDDVYKVQRETIGQGDSTKWHNIRHARITATKFHRVLTCTNDKPTVLVSDILGEAKDLSFVPAINHGRNMEPIARRVYIETMKKTHKNFTVEECGIFVDIDEPYLGASPDGLVSCNCCGEGVIEIKCPYSIAHLDPNETPPDYVTSTKDGSYKLKRSHMYYSQVQGQLAITGKSWCDFVIFTKHGHIRERIHVDEVFCVNLKAKLKTFFYQHVLPVLLKVHVHVAKSE